ncbi:hypothetical protein BDQ12DRAFT_610620 [Crucibulum laeve]|uniref:holo-[acyl-carrier-protein] synthase n=1 Tax=Crucibulum laeve TaxID=68775 RepID=A0A5C3LSI8_9AGAR|nr:hypothetical protein BDQ12DRAFT_610620 [Crucibulum laeve]
MGDCPILVWMLSLNREYTKDEYDQCFRCVDECLPHVKKQYKPKDPNSLRLLLTNMLPLLMMRHRRIPRAKWKDCVTSTGKHWIEQSPEDMPPEKFLVSMIGYYLAYENSICGMAMTQGLQRKVVNIGLGIKQRIAPPAGTAQVFLDSQMHKLTQLEVEHIKGDGTDETILRRMSIILALKESYTRAIGQPIGFDYGRIEFNVPGRTVCTDNLPLQGWEFRIFEARLGVARGEHLVVEDYQCAVAFFRGSQESTFVWYKNTKELESWVQFINIDQMIKVIPKLSA